MLDGPYRNIADTMLLSVRVKVHELGVHEKSEPL